MFKKLWGVIKSCGTGIKNAFKACCNSRCRKTVKDASKWAAVKTVTRVLPALVEPLRWSWYYSDIANILGQVHGIDISDKVFYPVTGMITVAGLLHHLLLRNTTTHWLSKAGVYAERVLLSILLFYRFLIHVSNNENSDKDQLHPYMKILLQTLPILSGILPFLMSYPYQKGATERSLTKRCLKARCGTSEGAAARAGNEVLALSRGFNYSFTIQLVSFFALEGINNPNLLIEYLIIGSSLILGELDGREIYVKKSVGRTGEIMDLGMELTNQWVIYSFSVYSFADYILQKIVGGKYSNGFPDTTFWLGGNLAWILAAALPAACNRMMLRAKTNFPTGKLCTTLRHHGLMAPPRSELLLESDNDTKSESGYGAFSKMSGDDNDSDNGSDTKYGT